MKKAESIPEKTPLRKKAESLLKKQFLKNDMNLPEADLRKLLHELQVHQIELELQNKELNTARTDAQVLKEKFIELYDFAPIGYFTLSKKGDIIGLNLQGAKLLGKHRKHLINSSFTLFVSRPARPAYLKMLEKVVSNSTKESCEVILDIDNKELSYLLLSCTYSEKSDNYLLTATDITKQIQIGNALLKSEERFSLAMKAANDGIFDWNLETNEIYYSPRWKEMLGYEDHELPNDFSVWEKTTDPVDVKKSWELQQKLITKQIDHFVIEFKMKHKDGHWVDILSKAKAIFNDEGKAIRIVGTHTDITKRKEIEKELIIAKEKAEESDRLKSAFLANMSHEIRTPMNGILGFAGLLKEPNLSGEKQQEYIQIIEKGGARMLNIISEIVDISKIESGLMKVAFSSTDINKQISDLYNFFKPEAENKGLQLSVKRSLPNQQSIITTDSEKLNAILTNLIKNAIKYTDVGTIEFGYTVETHHDVSLQFYVTDTGIGIPKDRQEAIFQRFIQADIADKMARQGAGLGLTISRAYVEMLGGKIWVDSELDSHGEGSTFYFTIPYLTEPEEKSVDENVSSHSETSSQIKKLKILIVEDDPVSVLLIEEMVEEFRREVLIAINGIEAIESCRKNPDIDLVLMDIKMSEMDGYEATMQIRVFNKEVIIIAQTAYALVGDKEIALEAGCNDYISKPINKDKLLTMIGKYF